MKINKYEFGHMTKMAAMPLNGKVIYIFKHLSPLKPLGQLKSDFMWRIHAMDERKFVRRVRFA